MITRINGNSPLQSKAIGSIGWSKGRHTFKVQIDGTIGSGSTTAQAVHWLNIGVATQAQKNNLDQASHYVDGMFFRYLKVEALR